MAVSGTDAFPALFRAGDIGVSSEWRDISYDWAHILTKDGVAIYTYLRDTFDHQRSLRPFILTPEGPTKTKLQHILGYKTSWPMDGPEYLLQVAGLLHVEIGYGQSRDPERPQRTRVAYYTVGRLDHPVLDWHMLDRLLDALMIAIETPSSDPIVVKQQKKAQAALRSLGQAGMFQDCDPDDLFYEYGAWPTLLPTLVYDRRWAALFAHLHGAQSVHPYRRQALSWVEWVQRHNARLAEENRAIAEQLLAAQRRGLRPGGDSGPVAPAIPTTELPPSMKNSVTSDTVSSQVPVTAGSVTQEALQVTQPAFVTGESPASHQPVRVTQPAFVIEQLDVDNDEKKGLPSNTVTESPALNQLTSRCWQRDQVNEDTTTSIEETPQTQRSDSLPPAVNSDSLPLVEPHLRDGELVSTRHDAYFWCAIQNILYGNNERYSYTAGEKQAAHRRFKQQGIPVGVVLAALRAVMTLPPERRPGRFADALKMDVFHACVQQSLALLPSRAQAGSAVSNWAAFLQAYRSVGQTGHLRDVSTTDYHALYGLFSKQPDECWDVLSRVERSAQPPDLSPAYLRRAIVNNQRAAAQAALIESKQPDACRSIGRDSSLPTTVHHPSAQGDSDPRKALLEQEGLKPQLLTDNMTEAYVRAWIEEANVRASKIRERAAWIAWGLTSGCWPEEHPKLPPRSGGPSQVEAAVKEGRGGRRGELSMPESTASRLSRSTSPVTSGDVQPVSGEAQTWAVVLGDLQKRLPQNEFDTWIKETALVGLEGTEAIVSAPHIFAREMLENTYGSLIASTLHHVLGFPVRLQVVIG